MAEQDRKLFSSMVQFGTLVGLMFVLIIMTGYGTFINRPQGMSDESIQRLEDVVGMFQKVNQESRELVERNEASNLELARTLGKRAINREATYAEMMADYSEEMTGVIPSVINDQTVEPIEDTEKPTE